MPLEQLDEVDRFALARYGRAAARMLRGYDEYDFSTVSQAMNTLATVDLSAFYVDVTKDRMYTLGARSSERRSTQTAMYIICDGLAKLLAPILPVTADDLWRHIPGSRSASVHLEEFPRVEGLIDQALLDEWDELLNVREQVNAALEQKRKDKIIGTSLGARVAPAGTGPGREVARPSSRAVADAAECLGRIVDRRLHDRVRAWSRWRSKRHRV